MTERAALNRCGTDISICIRAPLGNLVETVIRLSTEANKRIPGVTEIFTPESVSPLMTILNLMQCVDVKALPFQTLWKLAVASIGHLSYPLPLKVASGTTPSRVTYTRQGSYFHFGGLLSILHPVLFFPLSVLSLPV
jgi:hypothetical protein